MRASEHRASERGAAELLSHSCFQGSRGAMCIDIPAFFTITFSRQASQDWEDRPVATHSRITSNGSGELHGQLPSTFVAVAKMKFYIDELPVLFPYPKIYPEQYAYMTDLKRTLDANDTACSKCLPAPARRSRY